MAWLITGRIYRHKLPPKGIRPDLAAKVFENNEILWEKTTNQGMLIPDMQNMAKEFNLAIDKFSNALLRKGQFVITGQWQEETGEENK